MAGDGAGEMRGRREVDGRGVSPGGRPLDYHGSEGWTSRIISKSLAAGLYLVHDMTSGSLRSAEFELCFQDQVARGWQSKC